MNKTILVTGGSRGIGAATALLAARKGYNVCVNYNRDKTSAEKIANEILESGLRAITVQADISSEKDVLRMFETTINEFGYIDALVNNAGILEKQMRLDEMSAERFERVFSINITGYFLCAREAVRMMSTKHGGRGGAIVNVSSIAAKAGSPGEYIDYAATKGAVDTMTTGLAREVAEEGIRVNCVRPGFIYTDIHISGGEPDRVNRIKDFIPMKRGGHPEEVAGAILWLLSDEASFTTGTFIDVAGGK